VKCVAAAIGSYRPRSAGWERETLARISGIKGTDFSEKKCGRATGTESKVGIARATVTACLLSLKSGSLIPEIRASVFLLSPSTGKTADREDGRPGIRPTGKTAEGYENLKTANAAS
jgi:hypothetical protein